MSFSHQKKIAKATTLNNKWKNEGSSSAFTRRVDNRFIKRNVNDPSFGLLARKAYSSKRGYSLRTNAKTGDKEMFVRGTTFKRGGVEWLQNVVESPIGTLAGGGTALVGDVSRRFRGKYSKFLSDVARKEGVKVIYGHSRGAAVVEDMRVPGAAKLGIDGATILNTRSTITNYRQKQLFDSLIGLNSRSTIKQDRWTPIWSKRYHKSYSR